MNLSMNYGLAFVNREVGIYVFSPQDTFQKSHIEGFLSYLKHFCRYTIFDDLERIKDFNKQNSILIFFISSIADFRYLEKLSYLNYSLNIVAYFLYSKEFKKVDCKEFRAPIKALSFNIIYPDRYQRGLFYPNNQKIIDTVYYKSVRNKYKNIKIGDDITTYTHLNPKQQFSKIREIGLYFKAMQLNDTDSVAGAIAIRFGEGILINASNTDKYNITEDRICYVEKYILKENKIYWVGAHIPSSETAVAFLAFQEFPSANILLHFHDKRMTYTPQLARYQTSKYVTYGTPGEAKTIVRKLKETGNFAIANGHGEFLIASDLAEARAYISKIISIIT
jgi:ribulose-5-phosphate 4-epimerase/fuculose-1-phosphate aldolase